MADQKPTKLDRPAERTEGMTKKYSQVSESEGRGLSHDHHPTTPSQTPPQPVLQAPKTSVQRPKPE